MGIHDELAGVDLGDARLVARLLSVAERLEANPSASIASAMATVAEREGAYRLLSNDAMSLHGVLAPHHQRTVERVQAASGDVVVAHDTTEVGFSTPRKGLGRVNDDEQGRGLYLHTALAIAFGKARDPLGVIGVQEHARLTARRKVKRKHTERVAEKDKESGRWWELAKIVAARCGASASKVVHVMDREADNYVLLAHLIEASSRFVIRAKVDRRIRLEGMREPTLKHVLRGLEGVTTQTISIGPREPKPLAQPLLPPSRVRTATLEYRATRVTLVRPSPAPKTDVELPPTLEVNLVHVVEVNPPEGYEAIEWKLFTREPVSTVEEIVRVVELYDTRWVIEEYFKALKTGCALERRELESSQTILNCLAILMPIAWQILRIRSLARDASDQPAATIITTLQIKVLQRVAHVKMTRNNPTVRDVYLAIAKLGRHIKNNGPPGWQVLLRGYQELLTLARGLGLALNQSDEEL